MGNFVPVNTTSTFKPQLPTQSNQLPQNISSNPVFTTTTFKPQLPTGNGQRVGGSNGNVPIASAALATASAGVSQEVQQTNFVQAPPVPTYSVNRVSSNKPNTGGFTPAPPINRQPQGNILQRINQSNPEGLNPTPRYAASGGFFEAPGNLFTEIAISKQGPKTQKFFENQTVQSRAELTNAYIAGANKASGQQPFLDQLLGDYVPGSRLIPGKSPEAIRAGGRAEVTSLLINKGYSTQEAAGLAKSTEQVYGAPREAGILAFQAGAEVTGEATGQFVLKNVFSKPVASFVASRGGSLTAKEATKVIVPVAFGSSFTGGVLEAGIGYSSQQILRNKNPSPAEIGLVALGGGVFAGITSAAIGYTAVAKPGVSKILQTGAYLSDLPEFPGDIVVNKIGKIAKYDTELGIPILNPEAQKVRTPTNFFAQTNNYFGSTTPTQGKPSANVFDASFSQVPTSAKTTNKTNQPTPSNTSTNTPTNIRNIINSNVPTISNSNTPSVPVNPNIPISINPNVPIQVNPSVPVPSNIFTDTTINTPININANVPTNVPTNVPSNIPVNTFTSGIPLIPPFGFGGGSGIGSGLGKGGRNYIDEFALASAFSGQFLRGPSNKKKGKGKKINRGVFFF